ncbi:MAG: ABC transporter ATP-binding protein [Candidatus Falkowbacteria bacterium]
MSILKDNRIRNIVKLSRQAFGKYKRQITILTILGFLTGILEGIGVNAIIPLFSIIMGGKQGGDDIISQFIEKFFLYFDINFSVKYLLIFISLLFIVRAIALVLGGYIQAKITADYEEQTRNNLFSKTLRSSWPHLLKQKIGYLENILMIDIGNSSFLLSQISNTIMILTSLLIYTLVAINISFYITLITFILGGILFLLFKPLIYKTRVLGYETTNVNKKIAHYINENITGMKMIKALSVENQIIIIGAKYFTQLKKIKIKLFLLKNITGAFIQPVSLIFICVIFAFSYKLPNFNFASLAVIIYLVQRIFSYVQQLQHNLHVTNEMVPFLRSALDYEEKVIKNKEVKGGMGHFKFDDKLEFKDVCFAYNTEKEILTSVNFSISRGDMIGLIGPSGAGKTTIVDLILRLFNPTSGKILLDGKNIFDINMKEWRNSIGYVSQDIFLLNDTIANNIKFYDNSIFEKDIIKAAKMANIYDFIQSCSDGLATVIGERGVMLSAGQRQRIIIARILARQPKFLILDEATSALDNESEIQIQKVIENLKGKVTVLAIAHRLSTVINSSKLLVLDNGKIIEQGTSQKLLKDKESYFAKVYNLRK